MMPKDLFKEIIEDPIFKEKAGISENQLNELDISSKIENDFVSVLRIILYSLNNNTPDQTTYKSIKNHFDIN